jgi:type II secretory pathway component PulC
MALTLRQIGISTVSGCIVLLAFGLGWWEADDGNHNAATRPAGEWLSPKPIASDISTYAQILTQKPPFGAPAANPVPAGPQTAPGNVAPVDWRVGGIVMTQTSRHLIILIRRPGENATRSEIRQPGEELPDGSILRTVEPTNVMIERQGAIVTIKMFAKN